MTTEPMVGDRPPAPPDETGLVPAPIGAGPDHKRHERRHSNGSPHDTDVPTKHRFTPFRGDDRRYVLRPHYR